MVIVRALAIALIVLANVLCAREASAFCRTMTCPLPANWSPTDGCFPPNFASQCASLPTPARLLPVWWRNACVGYDLQKNASRWLDYATAAQIVAGAFAKWTGAMCPLTASGATRVSINVDDLGPVECDQVQYQSNQANQHVIVFRDSSWPHNDSSNTLGLTTVTFEVTTGELYDADTEINGTLPLSVGDPVPPGSYDVESIITHEMGHFLGLAHSGDASATMFARYSRGSTSMRGLSGDDIAGLCAIYPPDGTRNVDPSVALSGSVGETRCDPTPRHGFSSRCAQPATGGCAIPSGAAPGWGAGIVYAALMSSAIGWRRKRASRANGAFLLFASACSSATTTRPVDGGTDASRLQCAIDSDAGVGASGPPYCYPESTMPRGPCTARTPTCAFCAYPPCPVESGLIEPHTFYECSCTGGLWDCHVLSQFGTQCPAVLTCLGPDGGLGVSCLSGGGVSCEMPDGGSQPICVFAHGFVPKCGIDSCSSGCTCVDPAGPTCACQ